MMKKFSLLIIICAMTFTLSACTKQTAAVEINKSDSTVCGQGEGCTLTDDVYQGLEVGNQIPNFDLITADGKVTKLYDLLKGKEKFVFNLSADWCTDCKRQNNKLNEYYKSLPDTYGAAVVYVEYNSASGDPTKTTNQEQMQKFVKDSDYTFPAFYDKDNVIADQIGIIEAVPMNYVLDENGVIKAITQEIDMDNLFLDNGETPPVELSEIKK